MMIEIHLAANRNKYGFACYVAQVGNKYFYHTATVESKTEIRLMAILWAYNYIKKNGGKGVVTRTWKRYTASTPGVYDKFPELCKRIFVACGEQLIFTNYHRNDKLAARCWAEINPVKLKQKAMGGHLAFGKGETHAFRFGTELIMAPDAVHEAREIMKGLKNEL